MSAIRSQWNGKRSLRTVRDKFDLWVRELAKGPVGAPVSDFPAPHSVPAGRENPFDGYRLAIVPGEKREDLLIDRKCMAAANKRGAGWRAVTAQVTLNPKRLSHSAKSDHHNKLISHSYCVSPGDPSAVRGHRGHAGVTRRVTRS